MNHRRTEIRKAVPSFDTFIGVDLHKTTVTLAAVDVAGDLVERIKCDTKSRGRIAGFLAGLPGRRWLAVEAVGFCEWFIDEFRSAVDRIDIADATALSHLRGKRRRSDRTDALDIARRLARGECPLGYIAGPELMEIRKIGRHWHRLSRTIARAKHGMKSMLNARNLRGPTFDGVGAQKWLLASGHLLTDASRDAFGDLLDVVILIERQQERHRRRILAAVAMPEIAQTVAICKTVPGIADVLGCLIAAEVGPFDRFPNADALEHWAGITPDTEESAGRTQSGHITKAGSATLRWALGMAAMVLCRSDAAWARRKARLAQRLGKPKANVAMARRLLRTLYAMIRDGKPFERSASTNHTAKANRARVAQRRKAARAGSPRSTPRQHADAFLATPPRQGD